VRQFDVNRNSNRLIITSQTTGVAEERELPKAFALQQNYPNPFNPSTVISFQLSVIREAQLVIYSATGQLVRTLASGKFASGRHQVIWDGKDDHGRRVASGSYFYQIIAGEFQPAKGMLLLK